MQFFKKNLIFEPFNALVSGNHGLKDIDLIIKQAKNYLFYKGWLFIEHGWKQKLQVQCLFKKYNFFNIQSYKDYGGNDRVTIGQKK
ncbi:hypothetical protein [Buchnera aphidicola]|uniref:hypothetical protein n=1 Tax=Buchnera aphidicola TaxID=9 RepID=UPI001D02991C|nr:hypothetical protein [Buchnera aphidicola]